EVTYTTGAPVWIPERYLDTLQFKAPPYVSGTFTITVNAGTVDYDDNDNVTEMPLDPPRVSGDGVSVEVSGEATLTIIEIQPIPNMVTMSVNGTATGKEDETIDLKISATSNDPSELIEVVIKKIPDGVVVHYGPKDSDGKQLTHTGPGDLTIKDFNGEDAGPVSITPLPQWSGNIPLTVEARSNDDGVM